MRFTLILGFVALLCVFQQIDARSQRILLADEEVPKVDEVEEVAQAEDGDKTEKTEETAVDKIETKHDCAEKDKKEDNVFVIDADELEQILEWAYEAEGRATRRYKVKLHKGRRRGVRRGGGRRRVANRRGRRPSRRGPVIRRQTG